ncbi:MAG: hypothetical protein MJZ81_06000 [Bacteroidales bacterium]|nr:hypothetical protein [Bacteroidales bacterium]
MEQYSIFCTEAQTRKALELGAPIKIRPYVTQEKAIDFAYVNAGMIFNCPTAEQMIGWLEGLGLKFRVYQTIVTWTYMVGVKEPDDIRWEEGLDSRKEATLAAIDAALEYLSKNKK